MYSALKHQGKPLYEYARQGIEVEREARSITVYELLFIRWEGNDLELEIHCSKGTYIRTIIDDLGELLGCGAHVSYLRRLQVATYPSERMVTLEQLTAMVEAAQAEDARQIQNWIRCYCRWTVPFLIFLKSICYLPWPLM